MGRTRHSRRTEPAHRRVRHHRPLSTWHLPDQTKNREPRTRGGGARQPKDDKIRLPRQAILFEGTADVRDAAALRQALLDGIGRSKSYGCGLLSLAPARGGEG